MRLGIRKSFQIIAPGNSLQKRTAYSLAIVRLILVPVFFLAVYYLFKMSRIVDSIVNVDAPAATLAQQASIEMLKARRAERNYLLLHDPSYLESNHQAVQKTREDVDKIRDLEPGEQNEVETALQAIALYQERLKTGVSTLEQPGKGPADRIQAVVKAYEMDLDQQLRSARRGHHRQLIEELRKRVDSFDSQITDTVQQENPDLRRITGDLHSSSEELLRIASELEERNWGRIQKEHAEARHLIHQAEWVLSGVSAITLVISIWVSYTLPRQVIKPLLKLKEAVDNASSGNYEIDFDIQGKGEIVELASSLRSMFAAIQQRQ
ncbi:MAG TPA: HAMP domain-containing protein [Candidatus Acidoferrum sp.]|nr:HAMP domain-containing protein [Candidatus Acidoferrum sp.]